ncbi:MAG: hypothetical protein AAFZ04_02850 [Pseudomonadota bacterium]
MQRAPATDNRNDPSPKEDGTDTADDQPAPTPQPITDWAGF